LYDATHQKERSIARSYNGGDDFEAGGMITDDELADLPNDPELAFVAVEKILRVSLNKHEFNARESDFVDVDSGRVEYMTKVLAAARAFHIDALAELKIPRLTKPGAYEQCQQFIADVDFVTMQIRLHSAQLNREGTVSLDLTSKRKIHHFIQKIREQIEQCELEADKKEELLDKLNKFAAEVDRDRTKLQAGMAFFVTLCAGIGDGFEKLKPVRDTFDSISRLLGQAMQLEERFTPRLPPHKDRKRLEPPPEKQPPPPQGSDIDDDIPF
jgi:hypothetical protein